MYKPECVAIPVGTGPVVRTVLVGTAGGRAVAAGPAPGITQLGTAFIPRGPHPQGEHPPAFASEQRPWALPYTFPPLSGLLLGSPLD